MGYAVSIDIFNSLLKELQNRYKIYAPKIFMDKGRLSDTDLVSYGEIETVEEMVFDRKTVFSPKEIIFPINQTMFYFTKEEFREIPEEKDVIIFLRSCDLNGIKCLDQIFLENGPYSDIYYKRLRDKARFFLMDCNEGWENCFCVSMGSNKAEGYSVYLKKENGQVFCQVEDDEFQELFKKYGTEIEFEPHFIEKNKITVKVPDQIDPGIFDHQIWQEYTARCSSCGRCTVSCPTCSCFTLQDVFYRDNQDCGERRRVWASCMTDGFTDMAGGVSFRSQSGDRMRYKTMHKILDFKKRFGFYMCVGCGRCDDVCPEYISFSKCINRLGEIMGR